MPTINITVAEKRATLVGSPMIVCDNTDYSVQFTFDDAWGTDTQKTARFAWVNNGKLQVADVIFTGNTVAVPALTDTWEVHVGVFEGELSTTTPARIYVERSIRSMGGQPAEEYPGQYDHIMTLFQSAVDNQAQAAENAQTAQHAAQRAENAATNVEAIVAGNEAYTKTENDRRDAPAIVESATGAAIVVQDAADRPLRSLVLHGKTTQAGTPTPDTPVELVSPSGTLGVNLYGANLVENVQATVTRNGVTITAPGDGSLKISGTSTDGFGVQVNAELYLPDGVYFLSGAVANMTLTVWGMTSGSWTSIAVDNGAGVSFVADASKYPYYLIQYAIQKEKTYNVTVYPMVNAGTKALPWEAYKEPQALSYELPYNFSAGTLDCLTGELNYATIIKAGTAEWGPGRGASGWIDGFESIGKPTIAFHHHLGAEKLNYYPATLCSHFPAAANWTEIVSANTEMAHRGNANGLAYAAIRIKRSRLVPYGFVDDGTGDTAVAAFAAWLEAQGDAGNPVTFVGEINKTAQLAGAVSADTYKLTTTVLNDAGVDMDLEYVADTKAYIAKTYPSFEGVAF